MKFFFTVLDNLFRCPHPGIPINGNLVYNSEENFSINSRIAYQCNNGFILIGERQQECLFFLQWSGGGAPLCKGKKVKELLF